MTLTEFLLARIAEDEGAAAYAQTCDDVQPEDWGGWWFGHQQHYSRHDPARMLAECEAKRRLAALHVAGESMFGEPIECDFCVEYVSVMAGDIKGEAFPCKTIRLLALPYAGHPNYRDEWKPSP